MEILIIKDPIIHFPGNTYAEKKSYADSLYNEVNKAWLTIILAHAGKWMEVDADFLFTHSFNAVDSDSKILIDVPQNFVDAVIYNLPFSSIPEWVDEVQKRYDREWPGTACATQMSYWETTGRAFLSKLRWKEYNAYRYSTMFSETKLRTPSDYFSDPEFVRTQQRHNTGELIYTLRGKNNYVLRCANGMIADENTKETDFVYNKIKGGLI